MIVDFYRVEECINSSREKKTTYKNLALRASISSLEALENFHLNHSIPYTTYDQDRAVEDDFKP